MSRAGPGYEEIVLMKRKAVLRINFNQQELVKINC